MLTLWIMLTEAPGLFVYMLTKRWFRWLCWLALLYGLGTGLEYAGVINGSR